MQSHVLHFCVGVCINKFNCDGIKYILCTLQLVDQREALVRDTTLYNMNFRIYNKKKIPFTLIYIILKL